MTTKIEEFFKILIRACTNLFSFSKTQLPLEKPEPTESLIEPKSEYLEDKEESVEDLTFDDDMNDLNEMEQDNNRAGPSHDPSQHPGKKNLLFINFEFFLNTRLFFVAND